MLGVDFRACQMLWQDATSRLAGIVAERAAQAGYGGSGANPSVVLRQSLEAMGKSDRAFGSGPGQVHFRLVPSKKGRIPRRRPCVRTCRRRPGLEHQMERGRARWRLRWGTARLLDLDRFSVALVLGGTCL